MASNVVMMIAAAGVNALAFSGTNFLFSSLGSSEERKRHNLALEKLTYDREKWNQARLSRIDFINDKLKEQGHAERTFQDVNEAMQAYYDLTGTLLDPLSPEPQLEDYLDKDQLSSLQKGELTLLALGLIGSGILVYGLM